MDWIPLDINTPAERDAVCLALYHPPAAAEGWE